MTTFFESNLDTHRHSIEQETAIKTTELKSDAISSGFIDNSRYWLEFERVLAESVAKYGDELEDELLRYEANHTPIRLMDFDLASNSIDVFSDWCSHHYEEQRKNRYSHNSSEIVPFGDGRFHRACSQAKHRISGRKSEFKSKRSFWKWAIGDLRHRIWSGLLVLAGSVLYALLSFLTSLL